MNANEAAAVKAMGDDSVTLASLAEHGATDTELAAIYGVPVDALRQFDAVLRKSRARLAGRIRRALLTAADLREPTALAWLAEAYLKDAATAGARAEPEAERRADAIIAAAAQMDAADAVEPTPPNRERLLSRIRRAMSECAA